jgi:hypothetical protein
VRSLVGLTQQGMAAQPLQSGPQQLRVGASLTGAALIDPGENQRPTAPNIKTRRAAAVLCRVQHIAFPPSISRSV